MIQVAGGLKNFLVYWSSFGQIPFLTAPVSDTDLGIIHISLNILPENARTSQFS